MKCINISILSVVDHILSEKGHGARCSPHDDEVEVNKLPHILEDDKVFYRMCVKMENIIVLSLALI